MNRNGGNDAVMTLRPLLQAALLAALTALLAYVRIPLPFTPVPITGQTVGVMLAGIILGPRWAAVSMTLYLGLGLIGLPVYAGGMAGAGVLLGPTGGFLWGFILSAAVVGAIARPHPSRRRERLLALCGCLCGGMGVLYLTGSAHFALISGIPWAAALSATVVPFIAGDLVKVLIACSAGPAIRRALAAQGLSSAR